MKLIKLVTLSVVGIACAASLAWATDCVTDPVPCQGSQTVNGNGCSTGCPPANPNLGCCAYVEYRVNCDEGPDQYYRTRTCSLVQNCSTLVIPKLFLCTHL
jgi:hypothetical protein